MKKKEDKKKDLEALRQDLEKTGNLFVTGYEKLKVSQDFELRKVVRGAGAKYRVVKNNLASHRGRRNGFRSGSQGSARHDLAGIYLERSGGSG